MIFKLSSKIQQSDDTLTLVWEPSEPLTWQAGQLLKYSLPHDNPDDRGTVRWFTIASAPFEGLPRLTTRLEPTNGSSFKRALQKLEVGDSIEAEAPSGNFVMDTARSAVLIAGGIGITPFRAMLLQMQHDGLYMHVRLLYANRNNDIIFKKEIDTLTGQSDFAVQYFVNQRISLEDINKAVTELQNPIYYISGPMPMVQSYKDELIKHGITGDNIKTDYFPGYK